MEKKKKELTPQMALERMRKYCDYQERCHRELRSKLLELKIYGMDLEEIMSTLIQEGYLNEVRFAIAFVSGKFRIKRWGRNKIIQELKKRDISDYCIESAIGQIDESEYNKTIRYQIEKAKSLGAKTDFDIMLYTIRKGFENSLVKQMLLIDNA